MPNIFDIINELLGKNFFGADIQKAMEIFTLCTQYPVPDYADKEMYLKEAKTLIDKILNLDYNPEKKQDDSAVLLVINRDPEKEKVMLAQIMNYIVKYFDAIAMEGEENAT